MINDARTEQDNGEFQETDHGTIAEFIALNKITMDTVTHYENPNMPDSENMNHWRVTLKMGRRRMSLYYSQGQGIEHSPELPDVLDCLASDAAGFENARSLEDWADEYGYDTDSRKAERTFKAVEREAAKLKKFLDEDRYSVLLWDTERL